jgi:hypothetical protein
VWVFNPQSAPLNLHYGSLEGGIVAEDRGDIEHSLITGNADLDRSAVCHRGHHRDHPPDRKIYVVRDLSGIVHFLAETQFTRFEIRPQTREHRRRQRVQEAISGLS